MKNIRITFRLSPYQLARGLQIIKQLDTDYQTLSLNDIVKTGYHDYLTKMNKLDQIPPEIMMEIESLIKEPTKKQLTLVELIKLKKTTNILSKNQNN